MEWRVLVGSVLVVSVHHIGEDFGGLLDLRWKIVFFVRLGPCVSYASFLILKW